jgi:hypothetical protein
MEYLHTTLAGSGAFKVAQWRPGQQLVYERFDGWVGGELPQVQRVIIREVPSPATRRALIERGDVQISFDIPDKDAAEFDGQVKVFSTPVENCIHCVGLYYSFWPFQDLRFARRGPRDPLRGDPPEFRLRPRRPALGRGRALRRQRLAAPFAVHARHREGQGLTRRIGPSRRLRSAALHLD